jgi:hypothetical protein
MHLERQDLLAHFPFSQDGKLASIRGQVLAVAQLDQLLQLFEAEAHALYSSFLGLGEDGVWAGKEDLDVAFGMVQGILEAVGGFVGFLFLWGWGSGSGFERVGGGSLGFDVFEVLLQDYYGEEEEVGAIGVEGCDVALEQVDEVRGEEEG